MASACALLCGLVLATRVPSSFEPVRLKVVKAEQPLERGLATFTIPPDTTRFGTGLRGPIIVTTLRNDEARARRVAWSIDGRALGDVVLPGRTRERFDLVTPSDVTITPGSVIAWREIAGKTGGANADAGTGAGAAGAAAAGAAAPGAAVPDVAAGAGLVVEYLEVATIHGSSNGFIRFYIVPAGRALAARPPLWIIAIVMIVVLAFTVAAGAPAALAAPALPAVSATAAVPATPAVPAASAAPARAGASLPELPRLVSRALFVLSLLVTLFLLLALVSGIFSRFAILLTPASFATCALLVTAAGLGRLLLLARAALARLLGRDRDARRVDAVIAALLVAAFYVSAMMTLRAELGGNDSGLLQISRRFADGVPFLAGRDDLKQRLVLQDGGGYDGQFVYFIAFDPFLTAFPDDPARYWTVADAPPYRFGRIAFSLLTKIASANRPELYPTLMVWLLQAAHVVGALALAAIFMHYGRSPWWALLYACVPGFVQSVHVTLPESIAAAGLLGGYWCWLRNRRVPAAALFALSLLARETGAVLLVSLMTWEVLRRARWWSKDAAGPVRSLRAPVFALATLVAWRGYVCWRLFPEWGWKGFFANPENMGAPFAGLIELWRTVANGAYFPEAPQLATAATWYPLLLVAGGALALWALRARPGGLAIATVIYAGVALSLNYSSIWVHVGNGERGTYELPLMLLLSLAALPHEARWLRVALLLFFAALGAYLRFASVDARLVQGILPL